MASKIKDRINEHYFIEVCKSSSTMAKAAASLGIHFNSFKKRAIELNCYKPNQSGKGINKKSGNIIPIEDIIYNCLYPDYQTFKIKNRLIKIGLKKNICEECGQGNKWKDKLLNMELDHIDGDRTNHLFENLRMLCPNCHSQTETHRGKNKMMAK